MLLSYENTSKATGETVKIAAHDFEPGKSNMLVIELGSSMIVLNEIEMTELHALLGKALGFTD